MKVDNGRFSPPECEEEIKRSIKAWEKGKAAFPTPYKLPGDCYFTVVNNEIYVILPIYGGPSIKRTDVPWKIIPLI